MTKEQLEDSKLYTLHCALMVQFDCHTDPSKIDVETVVSKINTAYDNLDGKSDTWTSHGKVIVGVEAGLVQLATIQSNGASVKLERDPVWIKATDFVSPPQHMPPHQMRVIEELEQLRDRLEKLNAFINGNSPVFANLDEGEKMRLHEQATHMADYADVLERRVVRF